MDRRIKEFGSVSEAERLLLAFKEGRTLGGLRNVEATEILRRSEETDFGASEWRLTQYAKENGCWFDVREIKDNFKYLASGAESDVYFDKSGSSVLKLINYRASCDLPFEFLEHRITLHNTIFPETFYELVGFTYSTEIDEEGFYFITKQPFIDSKKPRPTQDEIDDYMGKKGFAICNETIVIGEYVITDLAPRNFVKDNNGTLFCVDPMIRKKKYY